MNSDFYWHRMRFKWMSDKKISKNTLIKWNSFIWEIIEKINE